MQLSDMKPETATNGDAPIVPKDLEALAKVKVAGELDLLTAAKAIASSGMFPDVKRQSQAVVKVLAGQELGIPPIAAMRGIHFITFKTKEADANGRDRWVETGVIELSANLRAALIKRSGTYTFRVRELDAKHCKIEFFEKSPLADGGWESVGFSEYSFEQAKAAGITADRGTKKSNWILYPDDMCFAAALRRGAKRFCPDLFIGSIELDDAQAVATVAENELQQDDDTVDAEIVEPEGSDENDDPAAEPQTSTEGDPGAGAAVVDGAVDQHADQSAPPAPDVAAQESLLDDPPLDEPPADGEEVPDGEPIYVGLVPVHRVEGHEPSDDTADRIKVTRIGELRILMASLSLTEGALEPIFNARYGFPLKDARPATADDFEGWIRDEAKKVTASA